MRARAHTYIHTYTLCPVSLSLLLSLFPFIGHCSILPDLHGEMVTPHIFLTFEHFDPISRDNGFVLFSPNDWNDLSECLPRSNIQIFDSDTLTCRTLYLTLWRTKVIWTQIYEDHRGKSR